MSKKSATSLKIIPFRCARCPGKTFAGPAGLKIHQGLVHLRKRKADPPPVEISFDAELDRIEATADAGQEQALKTVAPADLVQIADQLADDLHVVSLWYHRFSTLGGVPTGPELDMLRLVLPGLSQRLYSLAFALRKEHEALPT